MLYNIEGFNLMKRQLQAKGINSKVQSKKLTMITNLCHAFENSLTVIYMSKLDRDGGGVDGYEDLLTYFSYIGCSR